MVSKKMPSARAALKRSEPDRLMEIRKLKSKIKKLLKRGEAVYVEHPSIATSVGGKLM
jgi:hypothetical protein